jgi:hypothetical protein
MVAVAPTAHEICQISCAPSTHAAARTTAAPAGHEHCAQALQSDRAATHLSAATLSDCRSQQSDATVTASLIKSIGKAPMIASEQSGDVRVTTHRAVPASPIFRTSLPTSSRTQLRV